MLKTDMEAIGLPVVTAGGTATFHGTRHSFVTGLARAGVHPSIAQRLARHSTATMTLDVYACTPLETMTEAVNTLRRVECADARKTGTYDNENSVAHTVPPSACKQGILMHKGALSLRKEGKNTSNPSPCNSMTGKDLKKWREDVCCVAGSST